MWLLCLQRWSAALNRPWTARAVLASTRAHGLGAVFQGSFSVERAYCINSINSVGPPAPVPKFHGAACRDRLDPVRAGRARSTNSTVTPPIFSYKSTLSINAAVEWRKA